MRGVTKSYKELEQYIDDNHKFAIRRKIRFVNKLYFADNGCWFWQGSKSSNGYGHIQGGLYAHRVAYAWVHGMPSPDLVLSHACDNPSCVNPDHLEETTHRENISKPHGGPSNWAEGPGAGCPIGHTEFYTVSDPTRPRDYGKTCCVVCGKFVKAVCNNGHKLDKENTYVYNRKTSTRRVCRTCIRENSRKWQKINQKQREQAQSA